MAVYSELFGINRLPVSRRSQKEGLKANASRGRRPVVTAGMAIFCAFGIQAYAEDGTGAEGPDANSWNFAAGFGAVRTARYPGSRDDYTRVLPLVSVLYGRFFFGALPDAATPAGFGFNIVQDKHWRFGLALGTEIRKPRRASDAPLLRGWGDIKGTENGAVFGGYDSEWFAIHGTVSQDIGGKHEGLFARLAIEGKLHPTEKLDLLGGPEIGWANKRNMQTFFGVDAAQSAIAGIPQYKVQSGVEDWVFSLGANYRLTSKWALGAKASYGKYVGDAADSPVTTDKNQSMFGLFAIYRF